LPRLLQLVLVIVGIGLTGILAEEVIPESPTRDQQKEEVASAGISTVVKIVIVLLLFFVMSAMRTLSRKKLERTRQRRVKPWEDSGK
tara:strand:+ start:1075 stop:1335 length:261 start_codon:yes stop_codon:yes gene_type:complete